MKNCPEENAVALGLTGGFVRRFVDLNVCAKLDRLRCADYVGFRHNERR
jgi:hypothetical protein